MSNDNIQMKSKELVHNDGAECENCSAKLNDNQRSQSEENRLIAALIKISLAVILFFIALLARLEPWLELVLFILSYILAGGEVLLKAVANLFRGKVFDEYFLMGTATVGAFAIGEYPEAAAVMLFYQIGEFFNSVAVNRSRKSIGDLMDIRPDYANLISEEEITRVAPQVIKAGEFIIVKPGEKVPLDGIVTKGQSSLDVSALTGEAVPREVEAGSEVLSGSINLSGLLTIEVTRDFGESTVSKILELVQNASGKKAETEKFITKFAKIYTPAVVFSALALAVLPPAFIPGAQFPDWLYRSLVFLVASCPCALVVSIPLGFFGGIGGASRQGILVKGSNYLEALTKVDTVVFDKTGTLTKGAFKVTDIKSEANVTDSALLEYAAHAESYSSHPIAVSILKEYRKEISKGAIQNYEEIPGRGVRVNLRGQAVLAGNDKLMAEENIPHKPYEGLGTAVHLAADGRYLGLLVISDEIREDSQKAVDELRAAGVNRVVMMTGDNRAAAEEIGKRLSLDGVYAELLPDKKVERLEKLAAEKKTRGALVFIGDGINDAPVLTRADIGIAMGGLGSDAAIEAADIVLMNDEPSKLPLAIGIAKRTKRIVWQNIIFALAVKATVLIAGTLGLTSMWSAVFADVGVTFIAVLNSMRALRRD